MGCLKLTYHQNLPSLKVAHSNFSNERKSGAECYRYGFNGMEKDDEIKGGGNSYTTEFRMLDVRIGRWLSVDPVVHHGMSPYCTFDNNPIFFKDPSGADGEEGNGNGEERKSHTVESGDNLWNIAKNQLEPNATNADVQSKVDEIISYNGDALTGDKAGKLKVGQTIFLEPELPSSSSNSGSSQSNQSSQAPSQNTPATTQPKYVFEAGQTYEIKFSYSEPGSIGFVSYSSLELTYNGEKIVNEGFSTFGWDGTVGAFSGANGFGVTFYETMSGETLLEVFNQTDLINNFQIGGMLNYTQITGMTQNAHKLWEISTIGAGFSGGAGGGRSVADFK